MNPITITADKEDWIRVASIIAAYQLKILYISQHGSEDQKLVQSILGVHDIQNIASTIDAAIIQHDALEKHKIPTC